MPAEPLSFRARLQPVGQGFMPMAMIIVPEAVVEALGGKVVKRVVATLNGHTIRRGLMPMRTGERFIMVSKALRKELNLGPETEMHVTLTPDPDPDFVDMPDELTEGLAEWPEAEAAWQRLTPGRQRNLVFHINAGKQAETRARRVVQILHQLASGGNPFRPPSEQL
jgi:Bacteriocin-protection, YdeI or OmpD-Associated/Domain of unknown function (DUF1905)